MQWGARAWGSREGAHADAVGCWADAVGWRPPKGSPHLKETVRTLESPVCSLSDTESVWLLHVNELSVYMQKI